jgi:hypothetical protein
LRKWIGYDRITTIKPSQEKKEKICRERDKVGRRKLDRVKFDRHRFDRGRCGRGKFDRGKFGKFDGSNKFDGHKFNRHESDKCKFYRGKFRDKLDSGGEGEGTRRIPPPKIISGAFSLVKSVSPAGFRPQKFRTLEALTAQQNSGIP